MDIAVILLVVAVVAAAVPAVIDALNSKINWIAISLACFAGSFLVKAL